MKRREGERVCQCVRPVHSVPLRLSTHAKWLQLPMIRNKNMYIERADTCNLAVDKKIIRYKSSTTSTLTNQRVTHSNFSAGDL